MDTQIRGLHHVTAMTSSAEKNYRFFTDILGLRMIKKPSTKTISRPIIYTLPMMPVHPERI